MDRRRIVLGPGVCVGQWDESAGSLAGHRIAIFQVPDQISPEIGLNQLCRPSTKVRVAR
ncbi:hypothetical protein M413DRAFT_446896 [Hebeloma cylindrosporum]|uniref:Uncharacterized protein n=1 Tax=Hebeloma cylindrosporum TaxID=76867 RepID=A0A0C2YFY6_HEBCY|nr:hypothetical protein M413DRAFT_446896 [Hebeloma cylindrosporum h7]